MGAKTTSLTNNSGKQTAMELITLTAVTTSFKHLGLLIHAVTKAITGMLTGLTSKKTATVYTMIEKWNQGSVTKSNKLKRYPPSWTVVGSHSIASRGLETTTASSEKGTKA